MSVGTYDRTDLLSDIRSLSSGTISKVARDARILIGYQSQDSWCIDQVQSRFHFYAKYCVAEAEHWQAAWRLFVKNYYRIRDNCWKCGYQGATDYVVDGTGYEVRWSADPSVPYNGDYFKRGIMNQLGCVFRRHGMSDGYPPEEITSAFPGIVPLSATFDWGVDDDGDRCVTNWTYVVHPDFRPAGVA